MGHDRHGDVKGRGRGWKPGDDVGRDPAKHASKLRHRAATRPTQARAPRDGRRFATAAVRDKWCSGAPLLLYMAGATPRITTNYLILQLYFMILVFIYDTFVNTFVILSKVDYFRKYK